MRHPANTTLMAVLIAVAMFAVVTATVQAQEGPFYDTNEERLEEGKNLLVTETGHTNLELEDKAGQTITCTGAQVASGALVDGSSGANSGTGKEVVEYTGCGVTGNGAECKVEGNKIITTALKTTLGYGSESREEPILELLAPVSGATLAEPKFGGSCTVSSTKITGSVIGEMKPEDESEEKEVKFTKAEKRIWTESSGKLTSALGKLEAFGSAATEETSDETDTKQPVAILTGYTTALCSARLTMFFSKCNELAYFAEGQKFTGKLVGELTISAGAQSITCTESSSEFKLGKNPSSGKLIFGISEISFAACKTHLGEVCTVTAPAAGNTAPPWEGWLIWLQSTPLGINGFLTAKPVTFKSKCGLLECSFVATGIGKSMAAGFFNANDTNKPAVSELAELQFKAEMTSGIGCSGKVELQAVYGLTPVVLVENLYLARA
jgi:hypothetical protein